MNVPLKWLKQYVDIPTDLRAYTEKLSMIGHMLDKTTETETDTVLDLELRGNRADCYAILGIAREMHACYGGRFDIPAIKHNLPKPVSSYTDFSIDIKSPAVKRFYSCLISDVQVTKSPDWMQTRLKDYGMDPINLIVDVTNYVMIETGMPLHAFDKDTFSDQSLILRSAQKGETCETFDGGIISLTPEDVVFAGKQGEIYGLVGIVGSKGSGIRQNTTEILLECAGYDQKTIRTTMMRHGIQTDAGLRHSHDLHESLCDYTLQRAASLICELSGNKPCIEQVHDYHPSRAKSQSILFDTREVQRLSAVSIPVDDQAAILKRLDMKVSKDAKSHDLLQVTPPLYRTDVTIPEDLVEEVLRIWGYEHIPARRLSSEIPVPLPNPEDNLEEEARDIFIACEMNELVTVPFVQGDMIVSVGDPKKEQAIPLINPPTSNHTHLRTHMLYEHLSIASYMIRRGDSEISFFEIGKVYEKKNTVFHQPPHIKQFPYAEYRVIGGVYIPTDETGDFFTLKGKIETYLSQSRIENVSFHEETVFPYVKGAMVKQKNCTFGSVGIVDPAIAHEVFEISVPVYLFSLSVEALVQATKTRLSYLPYSPYPAVQMDLSIDLSLDKTSGDIISWLSNSADELIRDVQVVDVYEKKSQRSLLVRITYQSKQKTLGQSEVQQIHSDVAKSIQKKFNVTIRGRS